MKKRSLRIFALFTLLAAFLPWRPAAGQASRLAYLQTQEPPYEVILDNGFRIAFEDLIDNDDGSSSWVYFVEELPGSRDLGNWVLELPGCAPVLSAFPRPWEVVHPDPNSGLDGIKWETGGGFDEGLFSVTVEGQWAIGTTRVAAKGPGVALGEIAGPVCEARSGDAPPVAYPDSYTTQQDTGASVAPASGVLVNDDPVGGDPLTAVLISGPSHGDLTLQADGAFAYQPEPGFTGRDEYTYSARSSSGQSIPAVVSIEVQSAGDSLRANRDFYTLAQGNQLSVSAPGVLSNDRVRPGQTPRVRLASTTRHGTLTLRENGSFTYTTTPDFAGEDSFSYYIQSANTQSDPGVVAIQVADRAIPTVGWTAPVANGEIRNVSGERVVLEVQAGDNVGVENVTLLRWDAAGERYITIAVFHSRPFRFEIDTRELNMEWNQIFAIAADAAGNRSDREFIWLYRLPGGAQPFHIFLPFTVNH